MSNVSNITLYTLIMLAISLIILKYTNLQNNIFYLFFLLDGLEIIKVKRINN